MQCGWGDGRWIQATFRVGCCFRHRHFSWHPKNTSFEAHSCFGGGVVTLSLGTGYNVNYNSTKNNYTTKNTIDWK